MFNSHVYGVTSPPLTNNPFIDHTGSTAQRYPDISQPPNVVTNQASWGPGSVQYPGQQQQQQYQQPQQQQWQANLTSNPNGMFTAQMQQPQPTGYQMQSSFGQGIVSGSSYNYLNQSNAHPQQQQQNGYNPVQQQLQSPGYLAQFDPYSALGQGWGETTTTTTTITTGLSPTLTNHSTGQYSSSHINTPISSQMTSTSLSAAGDPHPREYIRTHKGLIESWDSFTWKTFLGLFDKLKSAWEGRKHELNARVGVLNTQVTTLQMQTQAAGTLGYAGYMQVQPYQQELARVQEVCLIFSTLFWLFLTRWCFGEQLAKEAAGNFGELFWTLMILCADLLLCVIYRLCRCINFPNARSLSELSTVW